MFCNDLGLILKVNCRITTNSQLAHAIFSLHDAKSERRNKKVGKIRKYPICSLLIIKIK